MKCFWTLDHDYSSGSHREEWLPASAEVELIFHCGARYELVGRIDGGQPHTFVMGQQEQHRILRSDGVTSLIAVRFHPWGAHPFFAVPVAELFNQFVPLEAIWGPGVRRLEERLLGARGEVAVALLQDECVTRLTEPSADLRVVQAIASEIIRSAGQLRMAELFDGCGSSQRQVERKFKTLVGMTPKRLARLERFQAALLRIHAEPHRDLTAIAYATGHADQAHFIREFRALYGKTPGQVRTEASVEPPDEHDVEFLQVGGSGPR